MATTTTDKTNYDLLTDDDGSGTVGTVWSKSKVLDNCYTPVDQILANTSGITIAGPFTANGTLTANGAMSANGGISARGGMSSNGASGGYTAFDRSNPANGCIFYTDAHIGRIYHSEFGDVLQLSNTGKATIANSVSEHGRTTPMGEWINAAASFANTDFTGGGSQTWDVGAADVITFKYMLIGKTYFIDASIDTTTVGGTPHTQLLIKIPGGFLPAVKKQQAQTAFDNGAGVITYARVDVANNKIEIAKSDLTNWAASTNNTYVRVSMFFEIQ